MDFQTLNRLLRYAGEFGHSRIRECGVSETECMLCSYICSHPDCTQDSAVEALKLDKTTTAKALHSLEAKGFVERVTDAEDRRRKRLSVTPAGIREMHDVLDLHDRWLKEVLSALTEEEQADFERLFMKLIDAAKELTTEKTTEET